MTIIKNRRSTIPYQENHFVLKCSETKPLRVNVHLIFCCVSFTFLLPICSIHKETVQEEQLNDHSLLYNDVPKINS